MLGNWNSWINGRFIFAHEKWVYDLESDYLNERNGNRTINCSVEVKPQSCQLNYWGQWTKHFSLKSSFIFFAYTYTSVA